MLAPDQTQHVAGLPGEILGPVPLVRGHRDQRPLGQDRREHVWCADVPSGRDGLIEEGVTAVKITGQNAREPLHSPGNRAQDARLRELPRGQIGVGTHLLDPPAARQGPARSGHRLGVRIARPVRVPA
jgi:hypothetical protein